MDKVKLLEIYREVVEKGDNTLAKIDPTPACVGQIRNLTFLPEEYFLVLEETDQNLFLVVPLSFYLPLLIPAKPPYYLYKPHYRKPEDDATVLMVVPTWYYVRREIIENYSRVVLTVDEKPAKEYIQKIRRDHFPWYLRQFLHLNAKRWANLVLASLLKDVEEREEEIYIQRVQGDTSKLSTPLALAAHSKYRKGENYFAVFEEDRLRLYLPVEYLGKTISVRIQDKPIFEGTLESVVLEILGNFRGFEEDLHVVQL